MAFDDEDDNIVQMELNKIIISEMQDSQFIWLKEVDGERKFAIVIGSGEAYAIDRRLKGIATQRPMTHDLLANVIEGMGGTIDRIEINNLEGGTFFARIHIRQDGQVVKIDSRPSDAIALGVATSVPIFVAEHVLEEVCCIPRHTDPDPPPRSRARSPDVAFSPVFARIARACEFFCT
jgi:bifunctional DNase/RNase